ncbi:SEL1-like repeat protein [Oceanisphaera marina]|nr:SEL1-like repeat protein [Oceanisphaera marina]
MTFIADSAGLGCFLSKREHSTKVECSRFFRAAEQGYAGAQYNLGLMYLRGEGVPQNDVVAYAWASAAAANGEEAGVTLRDIAAEKLTKTERAKAQALAAQYF